MNIIIEVTDELPTHWVVTVSNGEDVTVRVSPKVEAEALRALREDVALAVAGAVER